MDISYNIDKGHRQIFLGVQGGGHPPKDFASPQELFVPHQKYFAPPPKKGCKLVHRLKKATQ